ncbi:LysO family transporter [Escherichia coli]
MARETDRYYVDPWADSPQPALLHGLCGATSMDFTLPVLQRTGGLDMVPAAIVHGFNP